MRVVVLVNAVADITASQTTAQLMERLAARNHEVWAASVADMGLDERSQVTVRARPTSWSAGTSIASLLADMRSGDASRLTLRPQDVLLLRLNPARDAARGWAHETALVLARLAADQGVVVLNDPAGLAIAGHKLYLQRLPAPYRPRTIVARDAASIRAFVAEVGPCVLKPVTGTRGQDVFRIASDGADNFEQIVDVLTRDGYPLVQEFVSGAEQGDVRVLVLEGELLERDGQVAAVARVPPQGDFRSNVHVGGTAGPVQISDAIRKVVAAVGPQLAADGLFFVGLDFIGETIIEINAHSPGGLVDAELFYGVPFADDVAAAIERCRGRAPLG